MGGKKRKTGRCRTAPGVGFGAVENKPKAAANEVAEQR
jgi:hypothetical protein